MKKYVVIVAIVLNIQLVQAHFGSRGPFGGSVSCMLTFDSTVYVGTYTGGVYESTTSKLVAWRARPVGLKQGHITALAHTGKYLFASTADSGVYRFSGYDAKDRYWVSVNNGLKGKKITSIIAIDSTTLLVGTAGEGIFRSTNSGDTWVEVNNNALHHYDITGFAKVGSRIIHTALDGGAWATDDLGDTWFDYNDDNTLHQDETNLINYNPSSNELIILNINGLYKTSTVTNTPAYSNISGNLPSNIVIKSIANNGSNWYLATNLGVYSSPVSVINWALSTDGINTLNTKAIVPFRNDLVCGTIKEGVFKTSSASIAWLAINTNFNNVKIYSMHTSNDFVVAATETGIYVSTAPVASIVYSKRNTGLLDSLNVNDLAFGSTRLFAATKNMGVFESLDSAKTWFSASNGLSTKNVKKIFCDVTTQMKYVICTNGDIYKAGLTLDNWSLFIDGLTGTPTSMAFYGANVILTTSNNGVYISMNGNLWTQYNIGLANLHATSAAVNGADIYVGTNGSGVFVTDSISLVWTPVAGTPANKHTDFVNNFHNVNFIQAMHNNAGWVFASYKGGLYATSDKGITWVPAGNQFNLPTYSDINKIAIATGRIFVTTNNNALYSNGLSELPVIVINGVNENSTTNSFSLFPNPSIGQFDVRITNEQIEKISIYSSLGKLVEIIVPSSEKITLNYPKGVYLLKAETKESAYTQKIILE